MKLGNWWEKQPKPSERQRGGNDQTSTCSGWRKTSHTNTKGLRWWPRAAHTAFLHLVDIKGWTARLRQWTSCMFYTTSTCQWRREWKSKLMNQYRITSSSVNRSFCTFSHIDLHQWDEKSWKLLKRRAATPASWAQCRGKVFVCY